MKKIGDLLIVIYLTIAISDAIKLYNIILFYDSQSFIAFYVGCILFFIIALMYEWKTLQNPKIHSLIIATILFGINPLSTLFTTIEFTVIKYPIYVNVFLLIYLMISQEGEDNEAKNNISGY